MTRANSNLWVMRFEVLILRPVDLCLIVAAIVAFFHKDWTFGLFLLIVGFLVGVIGQGLPHHRQDSTTELMRGRSTTSDVFRDAPEGQPFEKWNPDEGYKLVAASLKTGLVLAIVVAVTLAHFHYSWYVTVFASILLVLGFLPFTLVTVVAATTWSNRKNLKAWRGAK